MKAGWFKCPSCDLGFEITPDSDPLGHCGHDCPCGPVKMRWDLAEDGSGDPRPCLHERLNEAGSVLPISCD